MKLTKELRDAHNLNYSELHSLHKRLYLSRFYLATALSPLDKNVVFKAWTNLSEFCTEHKIGFCECLAKIIESQLSPVSFFEDKIDSIEKTAKYIINGDEKFESQLRDILLEKAESRATALVSKYLNEDFKQSYSEV